MASLNRVSLIGNLGADPTSRKLPKGGDVVTLQLATTDVWRDKDSGEKKEATEWHRVVFFGRLAETAGKYLHKGSQIYVEGRLRTRKWQDQTGVDRYTTEIEASDMKMLGRSDGQGESKAPASTGGGGATRSPAEKSASVPPWGDEDIPFADAGVDNDLAFLKATSRIRRSA